jgi:hypothetical protein
MTYATMTKDELRNACKAAGIAYGKLTNDAMRAALVALDTSASAIAPQLDEAPKGTGVKIEKQRETRNGVSRPSAGGKCRAVWDALDASAANGEAPKAERVRELAAEHGFDKTTAQVQFYRWRKFNGISGR